MADSTNKILEHWPGWADYLVWSTQITPNWIYPQYLNTSTLTDGGKFEFHYYLTVRWKSFLQFPTLPRYMNYFIEDNNKLKEIEMTHEGFPTPISAIGSVSDWLPPISATASFSNNYISTFDGRTFHVKGSCKYLLLRDFYGGEFDVLLNYGELFEENEAALENILIRATGEQWVSIGLNGTFHEGEREVKLPFNNHGIELEQIPDNGNEATSRISVTINDGVRIWCSLAYQVCHVRLEGIYFNRVGGLLGNFNYEPGDDSYDSTGSEVISSSDYLDSWTVSKTCRPARTINSVVDFVSKTKVSEKDYEGETASSCYDYFMSDSSPYASCFPHIDPKPYFWRCLVTNNEKSYFEDTVDVPAIICSIGYSYKELCSSQGYQFNTPKICQSIMGVQKGQTSSSGGGTCNLEGDNMSIGEHKTYEASDKHRQSADIAVVIENANCNSKKDLSIIFKITSALLRKSGVPDVRFSLIKASAEAPQYQQVGEEWQDYAGLSRSLGSLAIKGGKIQDGGATIVAEAARKLSWRPGVSRNLVLVSCISCDETVRDKEDLLASLLQNDISLHLITKIKSLQINGKNAKETKKLSSRVYGYDSSLVYDITDYKKFRGSEQLLANKEAGNTVCEDVAISSNGSAFSTLRWRDSDKVSTNKFSRIFANRLVSSAKESPGCHTCQCQDLGNDAGIQCRRCGVPDQQVHKIQPSPNDYDFDLEGDDEIFNYVRKHFANTFNGMGKTDISSITDKEDISNSSSDEEQQIRNHQPFSDPRRRPSFH